MLYLVKDRRYFLTREIDIKQIWHFEPASTRHDQRRAIARLVERDGAISKTASGWKLSRPQLCNPPQPHSISKSSRVSSLPVRPCFPNLIHRPNEWPNLKYQR